MIDHCTLFPELRHAHHCRQHDIDYKFQTGKLKADWKLGIGVATDSGLGWGILAYLGTTLLGWPWYWKAGLEARKFK